MTSWTAMRSAWGVASFICICAAAGAGTIVPLAALSSASSLATAQASPSASARSSALAAFTPDEQVRRGFAVAQACEAEIDDDLTPYGECIGHAVDRLTSQPQLKTQPHSQHLHPRFDVLGLYFQAWLMADLAARQGSTRSLQLRKRYQKALVDNLRSSGWSLKRLCAAKQLACSPIALRLKQKL